MRKRRILISIFFLIGVSGLIFASVPFINSLSPGKHLPENYTEIDISNLEPNSIKIVQLKESERIEDQSGLTLRSGYAILVVKDKNNELHAYWLPTWEGEILMPYRYWGQHEGLCTELKIGKYLSNEIEIYCENNNWAEFLTKQWRWTVEGENLGTDLPDFHPVKF